MYPRNIHQAEKTSALGQASILFLLFQLCYPLQKDVNPGDQQDQRYNRPVSAPPFFVPSLPPSPLCSVRWVEEGFQLDLKG